jgi:hypothetical protein
MNECRKRGLALSAKGDKPIEDFCSELLETSVECRQLLEWQRRIPGPPCLHILRAPNESATRGGVAQRAGRRFGPGFFGHV